MILSIITTGVITMTAVIVGVRIYNVYFSWGDYRQMLREIGGSNLLVKGSTIIVTGCTSGIGRAVAEELYANGARIIMANRNESESRQIMKEFCRKHPKSLGELTFKHLDLCSMKSVIDFAADIVENEPNLHVLINNAAVFGAPVELTTDKFEVNTQVNHLAPSLLSCLLLPKLNQSTSDDPRMAPRVINVTSTLTKTGSAFDLPADQAKIVEQLPTLKSIDGHRMYASTKYLNLQFMRSLALKSDQIKRVQICFASPGFCWTRLHRYTPTRTMFFIGLFTPLLAMIMRSSRQGAQTIIGCSMLDRCRSDVLYHNCREDREFFRKNSKLHMENDSIYESTMKLLKKYL